jgi:hypothetical protein
MTCLNDIFGRIVMTFGIVFTKSRNSGNSSPVLANTAGVSGYNERVKCNRTSESAPPENDTKMLSSLVLNSVILCLDNNNIFSFSCRLCFWRRLVIDSIYSSPFTVGAGNIKLVYYSCSYE